MGETLDGDSSSVGNGIGIGHGNGHAFSSGAPTMPMLSGGAANGARGSGGDHDHGRVHPKTPRGDGVSEMRALNR